LVAAGGQPVAGVGGGGFHSLGVRLSRGCGGLELVLPRVALSRVVLSRVALPRVVLPRSALSRGALPRLPPLLPQGKNPKASATVSLRTSLFKFVPASPPG